MKCEVPFITLVKEINVNKNYDRCLIIRLWYDVTFLVVNSCPEIDDPN